MVQRTLARTRGARSWRVGRGRDFIGTIDVETGGVRLLKGDAGSTGKLREMTMAEMAVLSPKLDAVAAQAEFDLVRGAVKRFDLNSFRDGNLTPVVFGS